jgi:hypothetical protein
MPSDLVSLDGVAYSDTPTGPWVPASRKTGVFKEPKRRPMPEGMLYDPRNKVVDQIAHDMEMKMCDPHVPIIEKDPTVQA